MSPWSMRWGRHSSQRPRATHELARWVFLRALGVVYLIAFVSLWTQIIGLVGHEGILPIESFLSAIDERFGPSRFHLLPTLFWFNASDASVHLLCAIGTVCSVLLIVGVASVPVCGVLWLVYLSLTGVGQIFLSYQWDILLLEAGFLAIFFSPLTLRPARSGDSPPSLAMVWLVRWLAFRLIFASGVVKLTSGDATWRDLTALMYHYETQPIPTWISWYAHQLPVWFQKVSLVSMFAVELVVPFLIFFPSRIRRVACVLLIGLQLLIIATGNYCFFNLLAIALCLVLLNDTDWPAWFRRRMRWFLTPRPAVRPRPWPGWVIAPVSLLLVVLTIVPMLRLTRGRVPIPGPLRAVFAWTAPFQLVNGYGLFAVMTTTRPEIVLEGSDDQETWQAYEFHYKSGDVHRRPVFVAPHQPRLDWQMWFAALRTYRQAPWFLHFCQRVLEGSPAVLALLKTNPFPDRPPRYLRAVLYDYQFTDPSTRRHEGTWWTRKATGLYCPVLSLQEG